MNPLLPGDGRNVGGELWKVEKADVVAMGGIVKSQGRAAGACSQYCYLHYILTPVC
jgi:hypothetical protein